MPPFHFKHNFFQKLFFLSVIIAWKNLDKSIWNSESLSIFKRSILKFIRSFPNSTYNCFHAKVMKNLTRFFLGLSYLHNHKFKLSFLDWRKLICSCGFDIEMTRHFLLHCLNFVSEKSLLLKNVSIYIAFLWYFGCQTSLLGDEWFDLIGNKHSLYRVKDLMVHLIFLFILIKVFIS